MPEIFLLCRDCLLVHPVCAPRHAATTGGILSEEAATAYGEFLVEHRHHVLEIIERHGQREHQDGSVSDPMRTTFIEVTDGHQVFTVRCSRESVDLPRVWKVSPHRIEEDQLHLTVREHALRRALDRHFYPYTLRRTKVDDFLRAVNDVVADLPADDLDVAFDDGEDPAVSIARLPNDGCAALLTRCRNIFDPWELVHVTAFVSAHSDEYGTLALRLRRASRLSHAQSSQSRIDCD